MTEHRADDNEPCWSADGRWIYFGSNRAGKRQICRVPSGGGDAQLIAKSGGMPFASPDGKWVYAGGDGPMWRFSPDGGEETAVIPGYTAPDQIWVNAEGIYYGGEVLPQEKKFPVYFYRFADGKRKR